MIPEAAIRDKLSVRAQQGKENEHALARSAMRPVGNAHIRLRGDSTTACTRTIACRPRRQNHHTCFERSSDRRQRTAGEHKRDNSTATRNGCSTAAGFSPQRAHRHIAPSAKKRIAVCRQSLAPFTANQPISQLILPRMDLILLSKSLQHRSRNTMSRVN